MSRRFFVLLLLLSTVTLSAQSALMDNCGPKSPMTCALHVVQDEVGIVTAPVHWRESSLFWVVPFGVGAGIGIDKDAEAMRELGVDKDREDKFRKVSDYGGIYAPATAAGLGYIVGSTTHNARMRETALLSGEAMVDSVIFNTGIKYAVNRQTPRQGDGSGRFWPHGTKTWPDGQSMPSNHSIIVWSFAHVVASEYDGIATKALVYSLATTVSASRVMAREHFPSDVFVGSVLGYVIGGYVVHRRSADSESKWNKVSYSMVGTPNGRGMQVAYNFAH